MALEGNLQVFELPEILQMISLQRKTGILTVQGQQDIIAVSFLGGQVVAADALNQTVEEGLGQILARDGLVRPQDFAAATAEHQTGGGRLADLLVERGYLTRAQLLAGLRHQTFDLLLRVLSWREGDFKFYSGDEVSYEEGFSPIAVEELLLQALGEGGLEAPAGAEPPQAHQVYTRLQVDRPVRVLDQESSWSLPRSAAEIWLAPEEMGLLDALDGRRSAAVLVQETGLGEAKVLHALYRLRQFGLAAPVASPAPTASPPAAPMRPMAPMPPMAPMARRPAPAPLAQARGAIAAERPAPRPRGRLAPLPASDPEIAIATAAQPARAAWAGPVLALVLAAAVVALLLARPAAVLLPFPWDESVRDALEAVQRQALYTRVQAAAGTFFLLEGRYTEDLGELVALRLLVPADLRDPEGRPLAWSTSDVSFTLGSLPRSGTALQAELQGTIVGNFLLDPEYLREAPRPSRSPLVLLD